MSTAKFDAPLTAALDRQAGASDRGVSVMLKMKAPLTEAEVADLVGVGVRADTKRTIFPANLTVEQLRKVAAHPQVLRVSLSQQLKKLSAR